MVDNSWCKKGGSRGYVTVKEVTWSVGIEDGPFVLTIGQGREFESSIPKPLRWLWSPDDPHFLKPALIHDHLLEEGWRRQSADAQWYEVALSNYAPKWKTRLGYLGMVLRRFTRKKDDGNG